MANPKCAKSKKMCITVHRSSKGRFSAKGKTDRVCYAPNRTSKGRFCEV